MRVSVVALPADAVAVNRRDGSPVTVAVRVSTLAVEPSVQLPTAPVPAAPVVPTAPVSEPLPAVTLNVTCTPDTGFAKASFTTTAGGVATLVPAVAVWPSPAFLATDAAGPAVPVAVKVTGLPVRLPALACSELLPALVPSVQLPTAARPAASEVATGPVILPPPVKTVKVTAMPATGLPN